MESSSESEYIPSEMDLSTSESVGTEVFEAFVEGVVEAGFTPAFDQEDEAQWDMMYDDLLHLVRQYFDEQ